ncbi:aldose epimerase family protein [Lacimicrobium alkaliphilum]|uniref:Aldose 1-epimerase n=1 Tax=Lacimicrobium alkaliphilum TaxID=1526571 RepID=A0ABQ1RAW1_9ALTE|nr:aldose epimerase family protein [Lacimicrobium alkaliphilum]GGD60339.1 aldose 1-epimerase [Lacimicrobium alkaliphilum]
MKINEIVNNNGMRCRLSSFGARVLSVEVPFAKYNKQMILGYSHAKSYQQDPYYIGATIGRVANRIGKGQFHLNGKNYQVCQNEGEHCLHGGSSGLSEREWRIEKVSTSEVIYSYCSPSLENGFPGQADLQVRYHLTANNEICISFIGNVSQPTPLSLTNHSYFTLGEGSVSDLSLHLSDHRYMVSDEDNVATGEIASLRQSCPSISAANLLRLSTNTPLDHCILLSNKTPDGQRRVAWGATLEAPGNNVRMQLYTDQPALQVYTSSALGPPFLPSSAVCLEAQGVVNSINLKNVETNIVTPTQPYCKRIVYKFSPQDELTG